MIVHGKFEELKTRNGQAYVKQLFADRLDPVQHSEALKPSLPELGADRVTKELKAIMYRIAILEINGRYEKS